MDGSAVKLLLFGRFMGNLMRSVLCIALFLVLMSLAVPAYTANDALPDPTSTDFCQAVQKIMASTDRAGEITLFTICTRAE